MKYIPLTFSTHSVYLSTNCKTDQFVWHIAYLEKGRDFTLGLFLFIIIYHWCSVKFYCDLEMLINKMHN